MRLLTAGPRAIAAALHEAGFTKTRIVLRQWNRNFKVSAARLDCEVPELLMVSSMQIHSACAYEMIADAYKFGEDRPLILAGGAKAIYEPWDFFGFDAERQLVTPDVACTGEEFILDRVARPPLGIPQAGGENLRKTFHPVAAARGCAGRYPRPGLP